MYCPAAVRRAPRTSGRTTHHQEVVRMFEFETSDREFPVLLCTGYDSFPVLLCTGYDS